jgi:hypothetical protein
MKAAFLSLLFSLTLLTTLNAFARDSVLPAGTLLQCTLDEPNFSSATASVGDPLLCHPHGLQVFGQNVFPRGAYIVGHLADDKDPGHFWGKGYLKIEFDRIGLPGGDLPFSAKMISVSGGYRVDKEGKVIGKGHATRDIVEWLLPPLWPWKILTLPARGPRPKLKGETRVTLRLMDDVIVPESAQWQRFGLGEGSYARPALFLRPRADSPRSTGTTVEYRTALFRPQMSSSPVRSSDDTATAADNHAGWRSFRKSATPARPAQMSSAQEDQGACDTAGGCSDSAPVRKKTVIVESDLPPAQPGNAASDAVPADDADAAVSAETKSAADSAAPANTVVTADTASLAKTLPSEGPAELAASADSRKSKLTLFALRAGTVYAVTDYWRDEDHLMYVLANGKQGQLDMDDLDWKTTSQLNTERNVKVTLREGR